MEIARNLRSDDGEIIALHITEPVPSFIRNHFAEQNLDDGKKYAEEGLADRIGGTKGAVAIVKNGHPGTSIVDYAKKVGADLIVISSHKPGLSNYFRGSTAARVVRHSGCAVHVIR